MPISIRSRWLRFTVCTIAATVLALLVYVVAGAILGFLIDAVGHQSSPGGILSGIYVYLSPMMFGIPSVLVLFGIAFVGLSRILRPPSDGEPNKGPGSGPGSISK